MIWFRRTRVALALLGAVVLCGCLPAGPGASGEEKEPHFLAGRQRVNAMDYPGAIEAFEKALEVNPRSAAAHFELGWLYAEKNPDPAAAIYHYEQYLRLRPGAENAETIKQLVFRLKQELAKAVLPLPSTPGVQRELEQLAEQNRQLREELEKWRAYYASRGVAVGAEPAGANPGRATPVAAGATAAVAAGGQPQLPGASSATAGARGTLTHKVQAGETPSSIARKYKVKLEALMAANPGLNPRRMQVGQSLTIPAP
jgi:tetratricopeptide (TPR) repeat protein